MPRKKDQKNRNNPQLPSEKSISQIRAHQELAHEDMDPIYPFQPIEGEKPKSKKGAPPKKGR